MTPALATEYMRTINDIGRFNADPAIGAALARSRAAADNIMFAREDGEDLDEVRAAFNDANRVLIEMLADRLALLETSP